MDKIVQLFFACTKYQLSNPNKKNENYFLNLLKNLTKKLIMLKKNFQSALLNATALKLG